MNRALAQARPWAGHMVSQLCAFSFVIPATWDAFPPGTSLLLRPNASLSLVFSSQQRPSSPLPPLRFPAPHPCPGSSSSPERGTGVSPSSFRSACFLGKDWLRDGWGWGCGNRIHYFNKYGTFSLGGGDSGDNMARFSLMLRVRVSKESGAGLAWEVSGLLGMKRGQPQPGPAPPPASPQLHQPLLYAPINGTPRQAAGFQSITHCHPLCRHPHHNNESPAPSWLYQ